MTDIVIAKPYSWLVHRLFAIDKLYSSSSIHEEIFKLYSILFDQLNSDSISFSVYSSLVDILGGYEYERMVEFYE